MSVPYGEEPAVLARGLDQLAGLLDHVDADAQNHATPCRGWTVQDLVDHIVAMPATFARLVRGEAIAWSAPTPPAGDHPAESFRTHAEELLRARHEPPASPVGAAPDWECAEVAVHTWDLATALGRRTDDLDPEVAERGLAFVRANLTEDMRSPVFGPERPAPKGGNAYQRIAAFAGRVS